AQAPHAGAARAGVGARGQPHRAGGRACGARRDHRRRRARVARRGGEPDPREATLARDARERGRRERGPRKRSRTVRRVGGGAGWWFVAPALALIALFFLLPVLAALVLSFTDFDIYGIADVGAVRWIGVRNYAWLLREPPFWAALKNTFYFALVRSPLTVATLLGA